MKVRLLNSALILIAIFGYVKLGYASEESKITCHSMRGPNGDFLECEFIESWAYAYGSNALDVIEATAAFAKSSIATKCQEHQLVFGRYNNPKGTGGISDFSVNFKDKGGLVEATMSGRFYCVK